MGDRVETETETQTEWAALFAASESFDAPTRGEVRTGQVVAENAQGLIINLGLKRDGVLPRASVEKLRREGMIFEPGTELAVIVVSPEDHEGNVVVALHQNRQNQDWLTAEQYLAEGRLFEAEVSGHNRGGLIVPFGELRAFVPASQVADMPRNMPDPERAARLAKMAGQKLPFKFIEVDEEHGRLVLSHREAQREWREHQKTRLMEELAEGQRRKGVITGLRDFGAFVDLGGADGLIHISELSWRRVKHPREVVHAGEEVEVLVVKVDRRESRIGLSLKQLQPDPWTRVRERFALNQIVDGQVTRIAPFVAFVDLGEGIEGLLHTSQAGDGLNALGEGQSVRVRVSGIEPERQRIALSLRGVRVERVEEPAPPPDFDRALEIMEDEAA